MVELLAWKIAVGIHSEKKNIIELLILRYITNGEEIYSKISYEYFYEY